MITDIDIEFLKHFVRKLASDNLDTLNLLRNHDIQGSLKGYWDYWLRAEKPKKPREFFDPIRKEMRYLEERAEIALANYLLQLDDIVEAVMTRAINRQRIDLLYDFPEQVRENEDFEAKSEAWAERVVANWDSHDDEE